MITFWLIAATMITVSAVCVMAPLLRRCEPLRNGHGVPVAIYRANFDELEREVAARQLSADCLDDARVELERRLVDETGDSTSVGPGGGIADVLGRAGMAALILALLPSAATVLYMRLGDPAAVAVESGGTSQLDDHVATQGSLEVVVSQLVTRLRQQPDDAEGWAMLARSYVVLDRADDAVVAYRRALVLKPRDADLLADYADALATARGGDLNGEALQSIDAALAVDPDHPKALALAASAAHDSQNYSLAIHYWQRLKDIADPGSAMALEAQRNIDAEAMAANPVQASAAELSGKGRPTVLEVHIRLSPSLSARTRRDEQVFVYALAEDGSRVPLAVQRVRVDQLPSTLRLDDSMAMMPERKLSDFDKVIVEAHVSASGSAQLTHGDLIGTSGPVTRGRAVVNVTIDGIIR
ncbi:c-type cytochrome biogenesis protein CcmI [Paraburkholderia sp. HD33-4]|uniref:c-type cytochrome biogenesis protein CcmI n=1 Tax=Paraburkholderia sp. HD33-4 TaxID=2883242 RepID=UPI001F18BF22|nr:c-type cytochrome biogenesis protein CcmI [Paraburkholderia sp. HD33-4]